MHQTGSVCAIYLPDPVWRLNFSSCSLSFCLLSLLKQTPLFSNFTIFVLSRSLQLPKFNYITKPHLTNFQLISFLLQVFRESYGFDIFSAYHQGACSHIWMHDLPLGKMKIRLLASFKIISMLFWHEEKMQLKGQVQWQQLMCYRECRASNHQHIRGRYNSMV